MLRRVTCKLQSAASTESTSWAGPLLRFWFEGGEDYGLVRPCWFDNTSSWQARLPGQCSDLYARTVAGRLDATGDDDSTLALLLLLDQVPRSLHRGTPRAYATDERARDVARAALAHGRDLRAPTVRRAFFYWPLVHSESADDQRLGLAKMRALAAELPEAAPMVRAAEAHHDTVVRFGRLPERNAILGRVSTAAEVAWLARHPTA